MSLATEPTFHVSRRWAFTLAVMIVATVTARLAGEGQPAATGEAAAKGQASSAGQEVDSRERLAEVATALQPRVIVAEHVLLWNNKIVTWDEVLERFREVRRLGPLHPSFYFTNGVHANEEKGWQYWHDEIMNVYGELFEPAGVTFASIAPRGGRRYDQIRSADDLRPDPTTARAGRVLTPDGNAAAGAQVIVLPLDDNPNVAVLGVALEGKRLRDEFDEQWVASDAEGRFTIHPTSPTYFLAVLHESGVEVRALRADEQDLQVRLEPWATITFSTTGDLPGQTASLSIRTPEMPPQCPEFTIYEVKSEGQPVSVPVPPGEVVVRRTLAMEDGSSIGLPASNFAVAPGDQAEIALDAASFDEELRARELHEELRRRRSQ